MTTATSPEVRTIHLSTGVRLPYVELGDPKCVPVILLHGGTDSWRSFEPVLPYLPESIHAVALTQRGHGDADRPASGYLPRDFAADVAAFLDRQGQESAIIVGHSMGATVAQRFALDYPKRVRGLLLSGAFAHLATNPDVVAFSKEVVSSLEDPIDRSVAQAFQESTLAQPIPDDLLETVVTESLKVPARVWRAVFAGLLEDDLAERLSEIAAPTLLTWGDQDAFVPRSDQEFMLAAIAGSRLETYRGVGHAIHWEVPQRFAADIVSFVQRVSG